MQIKIDFLCRDSILAAPLVLDLVLLSDLAARAGRYGIQRFFGNIPVFVGGHFRRKFRGDDFD